MTKSLKPLVGIFADDLTGALDAAAPFAERGFRTLVSPTPDLPMGANSAEVVSINLGTRHKSPEEITEVTRRIVRTLAELDVNLLFNKIDSTLRGNPAVELVHAMAITEADHAILCPAYPQNGRTVSSGVLLVDDVPVSYTDVGRDQLSPLPSSNVVDILEESLKGAGVRDQVHVRSAEGGAGVSDMKPIIIAPDARSENDLQSIADRITSAEGMRLVAGSAGIATALAASISSDRVSNNKVKDEPGLRGNSILIVTASQRALIDEQLQVLNDQIDIVRADVSVDEALSGVSDESIQELVEATGGEGIVVFKLDQLDPGTVIEPVKLYSAATRIIRNLGAAVRQYTDATPVDTLVIIGGDTSSGILEACGVSALELRGEFQPGTVSGIALDGSLAETLLVTRAGGFGDENSLLELVSLLEFGHEV